MDAKEGTTTPRGTTHPACAVCGDALSVDDLDFLLNCSHLQLNLPFLFLCRACVFMAAVSRES